MMKKLLTLAVFVVLSSFPALAESNSATCLATNLYHEARGEEPAGTIAAGFVVINRVNSKRYPNDVCSVIKQGGEIRNKCQFSWWCDGKSDKVTHKETYKRMLLYARLILEGRLGDPSAGALFYHSSGVDPYWSGDKDYVVRLGQHIFYK